MCGRYGVVTPVSRYADMLGLTGLAARPGEQNPNYDVRPGSCPRLIHLGEDDAPWFVAYRWGFVPSWAKNPKGAPGHPPPINARVERLLDAPTWRHVARRRRCLVPADAWYEWMGEKSPKQRYCFRTADHEPFAFGGVWDLWGTPGSEDSIPSFAIVTRPAQAGIEHIHDRMPLIVPQSLWMDWMSPTADAPGLISFLAGTETALDVFPVEQGASGPGLFVNSA